MSKFWYLGQSLIDRSDLKQFPEAKQLYSPWYHWSVFVNETVFEITGPSMEVINYESSEEIFVKNNLILARVLLDETSVLNEQQILVFIKSWIQRNPTYWLFYPNCQDFAKEFAETFFGIILETQTNKYLYISAFLVSIVRAAIPIVVNAITAIVVVIVVLIAVLAVAYVLHVYGMLVYERPHIDHFLDA